VERLIGRRKRSRLPISVSARLETPLTSQKVEIENLSVQGARIKLLSGSSFSGGWLKWLGFKAYVDFVWADGQSCGLRFDPDLEEECVRSTTEFFELIETDPSTYLRLAAAWVHGPGDY
jgi:hypothetical protein